MKKLLSIALFLTIGAVQAADSSPAKKDLVARILKAQQVSIENIARSLAERPALLLFQQAGAALQARVPADRQEAVGKEIQGDLKKFVDEATPIIRDRAIKLAPSTIGTLMEAKFTEEELKQLVSILESPVNRKYQQMAGELHNALAEKLVNETRGLIEPKVKALEQSLSKRLGLTAPANGTAIKPNKP